MISNLTFAAIILMTSAGIAQAEEINQINEPAFGNSPRLTNINRSFELNIDSERIIQQNYKSSTAINFSEDHPRISLQVGSVVRAREINMHLQNIRGQVHFRGTWEPILQNLRSRLGGFESQSK